MPATAPSPKKKTVPAKGGAAPKSAPKKSAKKSNIIPDYFKGKIIVHPDFFDEHDRPANWPSAE